jgi:hypothetical protein
MFFNPKISYFNLFLPYLEATPEHLKITLENKNQLKANLSTTFSPYLKANPPLLNFFLEKINLLIQNSLFFMV